MTLGEIILWGPLSYPLQFTDLIAIEHGSTVVALKMMEMRSTGVVFFPLQPNRLSGAKAFLVQELRKVCERIEAENHPYTVSMGIGSLVSDLAQFRQAYECAEQSIEMGRAFQERSSSLVTHYEDLGLFRVVSLAESPASLKRFCQDVLGPLLSYDHENGTELVHTLRVFLEQNQNSARASKALFIHYNTLRYRLDRIREILGAVLDNPQQRLTIEIALQFYPLVTRSHPK